MKTKLVLSSFFLFLFILTHSQNSFSEEVRLQILHTSDLHSHFTNRESPYHLGGMARLKSKIDQLRKQNENLLLFDTGDWTEGTIFFTLNSGEASHRLMEQFHYDAIVLGNHEWLIGPKDLYEALSDAKFKTPILSANLGMQDLPTAIALHDFIHSYQIKTVGGVKVGIFGLSTFQMIYDKMFEPVKILDPVDVARMVVHQLREQENCDVVIALSHLGIDDDKKLAEKVSGIDLILGGHTHIITKDPIVVNGTPILHMGTWGQLLGDYELRVEKSVLGKAEVSLSRHTLHPIDGSLPSDPLISYMVDGYTKEIEKKWGNVFHDAIVQSEVALPLSRDLTEHSVANFAVDAIQEATDAEVAFDHANYASRQFQPGIIHSADIFNLFPHTYNKQKDKAWTVHTFQVSGLALKLMMHAFARYGYGVQMSHAQVILDMDAIISKVNLMQINGEDVKSFRSYKVAATDGILASFDFIKDMGVDLGVSQVFDTGIEAWRVIAKKMQSLSPITRDKTHWQGRVRTLQPDIHIPAEQVVIEENAQGKKVLKFQVINAGYQDTLMPEVRVTLQQQDRGLDQMIFKPIYTFQANGSPLPKGEWIYSEVPLPNLDVKYPYNALVIAADSVEGENNMANNVVVIPLEQEVQMRAVHH